MRAINSKGQILVMVLLIMSAIFIAGTIFIRSVISEAYMSDLFINKEKAFYIAEAGLEEAKLAIYQNANWFTDDPHNPDDDAQWLMHIAIGAAKDYGGGKLKIVRESGRDTVYVVGYFKSSKVVLKASIDHDNRYLLDIKIL